MRRLALLMTVIGCFFFFVSAASPPLSDVIKREQPRVYRLQIHGIVTAFQSKVDPDIRYTIEVENTPVVFPVVLDGGFHVVDESRLKAKLTLDDHEVDGKFELLPRNGSETKLARFDIEKFRGNQVNFYLTEYITCYNARVDEARLLQFPWPEAFPPEVQAYMQPETFIESTNESIAGVIEEWTQGRAKSVTPYVLAKELARRMVQHYQRNGSNIVFDRMLSIEGFEVQGADVVVKTWRGSPFDGVCLYVALCRAAGLPARPVIGIDIKDDEKITAWAEVYIPAAGWVSVDLLNLFRAPGRLRDIQQPWPGVGTNDDLNEFVPISTHFHPPAWVRAEGKRGKPLMWGWVPQPKAVPCEQRLRIDVSRAATRGGG